jgi:S-DNA-T family DNA segregation ATPase FtsK/SpoIIIE
MPCLTRVAIRLDEPEQPDMVLGDGARGHGALGGLISSGETTGAGGRQVRLALP